MTLNPKVSKLLKYTGIAAVVAIVAWIIYRFWNGYKSIATCDNDNTDDTTPNSATTTSSTTASKDNTSIKNDDDTDTVDKTNSVPLDTVRSSATATTPSTSISIGNNSSSIVSLQPANLNTKLEVSDINFGLTI